MKKSDISDQVAAKTSLSKSDAAGALDAVLEAISDALARGRVGQHCRIRQFLRQEPPGATGAESQDWGGNHHRRLEVAVLQGGESTARCRSVADALAPVDQRAYAVKKRTPA